MHLDTYIKKYYLIKSDREIADAYSVSKFLVQTRRRKLNLYSPIENIKQKRSRNCGFKRDKSFDKIIKQKYLTTPVKTLAQQIQKSETFISHALKAMGLTIPPEIIAQRKVDSQIKKGNIPLNKGKKMSTEQYKIASNTFFKKGHNPVNTLPDVALTIRKDSKGRRYFWIKQGYKNWKMYHVEIWERENGPVPPGYIVVFKDKNPMHCVIENLEIITHGENMLRNTIHNLPEEIKSTIHLIGRITRKINKHERQNQ